MIKGIAPRGKPRGPRRFSSAAGLPSRPQALTPSLPRPLRPVRARAAAAALRSSAKRFCIILAAAALAGCNSGMYEMLRRTTDDPAIVKPVIESFVELCAIRASWEADAAADEYILERAEDSPFSLLYETVYRGAGTVYTDRGLEDSKRYIYRLSKRRGKMVFGPSEEAMGVSSQVCRDIYRNDTMEQALELETIDYIANIFYYRTYGGLEVMDEDWYYIELPPLRQASVVVNDSRVEESDRPTHFEYYEYGRDHNPVRQLKDFWIINNEMEKKRYYFKLYPAKSQFVGAGIPAGGDIVQYRISIGSIVPIRIGG
jgi:hypothetical protein